MKLQAAIAVARESLWLSQQSEAFKDAFCARMKLVSLSRNLPLFHDDDSAHDIYCLVEGTAIISVAHPVLGVINAHAMQPGRWFGEPATLGKRPRIMSVFARQSCRLVAVGRAGAEDMLRENPDFCWNFFNLLANNAEEYLLHGTDLLIQDSRQRLCSRLLTLAGRRLYHLPNPPVSIPFSQEELALASNMSRQTVRELLGDLVKQGLCELAYREIRVLDLKGLARIVTQGSGS